MTRPIKDGSLCRRIVEALEEQGPMDSVSIAEWVGCSYKTLSQGGYLNAMGLAGRVHRHAVRTNPDGGHPITIWAAGDGDDAIYCKVAQDHKRAVARHRERLMRERWGNDIARKMLKARGNGGAEQLVIAGRKVYQRKTIRRAA